MSKVSVPDRLGNWILDQNLGSGFSGSIWRGTNPFTGQIAAIKVQHVDSDCPTNRYERNFYPSLQGGRGMPTLWAAGVHQGVYDYIVIDLLGASLDNLYRQNQKQVMDLRSVVCIAMQVISRLEFMHSRGILHRDIQLGNCVLGLPPNEDIIYMIDFGFSKRYIDPATKRHIPDSRAKRDFIGNYWFSSVNVHCRGKVPSRRDDLEALALMLIHLLTPGGLPWTRNGVPRDDFNQRRLEREKLEARPDDLCKGLPEVFEDFLRYCRRLKFAELPDYEQWRGEFAELAKEKGWADAKGNVDDAFVWPPKQDSVLQLRPVHKKPPQVPSQNSDLSNLLADLANMDLNQHQIKGAKKPAHPKGKQAQNGKPSSHKENAPIVNSTRSREVIYISSDSESSTPKTANNFRPTVRLIKAAKLNGLTTQLSLANSQAALGTLVAQFADVFLWNKVMTREGFEFLEALAERVGVVYKDDVKAETKEDLSGQEHVESSRRASVRRKAKPPPAGIAHPSLDQQELLKSLQSARINHLQPPMSTALATMVKQFADALRRTNSRSVNKYGASFLNELTVTLDPARITAIDA